MHTIAASRYELLLSLCPLVTTPLPRREGQGGGSLRQGGESLTIIKVGGAVVEDDQQLDRLLRDFVALEGRTVAALLMRLCLKW